MTRPKLTWLGGLSLRLLSRLPGHLGCRSAHTLVDRVANRLKFSRKRSTSFAAIAEYSRLLAPRAPGIEQFRAARKLDRHVEPEILRGPSRNLPFLRPPSSAASSSAARVASSICACRRHTSRRSIRYRPPAVDASFGDPLLEQVLTVD